MSHYSDVYIVPQYSNIISRSQVDISSILDPHHKKIKINVPVISANMDTITDGKMAKAISEAGALGAIHRFMSIEQSVEEYKKVQRLPTLVSVGVNESSKERVRALYDVGAKHFVIDIAHGHHQLMKNMIEWIKKNTSDVYVMAGNVATAAAVRDLANWGADAIKFGIGPGSVCSTKNVTGVTVPQFTAVKHCVKAAKEYTQLYNRKIVTVADGGVREIGDIAKALGLGADFVMCGRLFAGCPETPHPGVYRGMASRDAMKTVRMSDKLPTPEGKTIAVETDMPVSEVIDLIAGGLKSSFSYSNASNLKEFQRNCKFGFRNTAIPGII